MKVDEALIKQLDLIFKATDQNVFVDSLSASLISILTVYGKDKKTNQALLETIKNIIGSTATNNKELSKDIINYLDNLNDLNDEQKKHYVESLTKNLNHPEFKDDTTSPVKEVKKLANSIKNTHRFKVFERSNDSVLEVARSRNQKVIWRARTQADEMCKFYNNKLMTPDEFKSHWPIHFNCMCTAELIPNKKDYEELINE